MATKYILDPSGEIIKVEDGNALTLSDDTENFKKEVVSREVVSREVASQTTYATSDFNLEPGSSPFSQNDQSEDESVINFRPNSSSFGFVNPDNVPNGKVSFNPMYHLI